MPALVGWLRMAEGRLDGHRPQDVKVSPMPRAGWPTRSLARVLGPPQDAADRIGAVTPVGDQPAGGVAAAMGLLLFLGSFVQRKTVGRQVLTTPDSSFCAAPSSTSSSVTANAPDSTASTIAFARASSSTLTHR